MKIKLVAVALALAASSAQAVTTSSAPSSNLSWAQLYGSSVTPRTVVTTDSSGNQTSTPATTPSSSSATYDQVNSLLTNKIKLYGYFTGSAVDSSGNSVIPFVTNNPTIFRNQGGSGGSGSSLANYSDLMNAIQTNIINKSSTPVSGI